SAVVHQSRSTALGVVALVGGAPPTGLWINSSAVNTVNTTPIRTVVDAKTLAALPGALVLATTDRGVTTAPNLFTNGLGQFLFFAPAARAMTVQASMVGYGSFLAYFTTNGTTQLTIPLMKLQGNGIVAGRVISEPTALPVYDVEVEVCPFANPGCGNYAYTNATGYFWVAANYGLETVTVVTEAFLTNTPITVNAPTDGWVWVGDVAIFEFAELRGEVRGLPSGGVLPGANVSVCSPFGSPVGPCNFFVPADAQGQFLIPAPPGNYVLKVADPGYNTSYLPLSLLPGENLSVGTIWLLAYGRIDGSIVSAISGAPVANATVIACATYQIGECSPFVTAGGSGSFSVLSPPGPVLLTATAPLYFDNFTTLYVPSGGSISVGTILLAPLSSDIPESVAGSVVASNRSNAPIPGAFVSALSGTVPFSSTATDSAGKFLLPVAWGTYTIVASAPGYAASRTLLVVHSNLTGVDFALATMTYRVNGTIRDALTGSMLPGIQIVQSGAVLGSTGSGGDYALLLANGTFPLLAQSTSLTGTDYAPLSFSVNVNGAPLRRDLNLYPASIAVTGEVVDAQTGLPIPGATVAAFGPGPTGLAATDVASATGAFRLNLGPGDYVINVSAPGFEPVSLALPVPNGTGTLVIPLVRISAGAALNLVLPILIAALAAAVVGVVAVALWLRSRPPPPPPLYKWTLDED
ncbi:MAG TPA: carboxypeptidase regulatory-like domain-containing protein, partial [Thermoplasmata archaeon]